MKTPSRFSVFALGILCLLLLAPESDGWGRRRRRRRRRRSLSIPPIPIPIPIPGWKRRRSIDTTSVEVDLPGLTCGSPSDQLSFQTMVDGQLNDWKQDIPCLADESCILSEAEITGCAKEHETAPRLVVYLTEKDQVDGGASGIDADKIKQKSAVIIKKLIATHGLRLGDYELKGNGTTSMKGWNNCPPGSIVSHKEGLCYPCPPGTYRATSSQKGQYECVPCPMHTFQPWQSSENCIPCPAGLKTKQTRSMSLNDCLNDEDEHSLGSTNEWSGIWGQGSLLLIGMGLLLVIIIATFRYVRNKSTGKLLVDN